MVKVWVSFLQDSSQIELLKELMDLQKDMVVMLLSMLEGMFMFMSIKLCVKPYSDTKMFKHNFTEMCWFNQNS